MLSFVIVSLAVGVSLRHPHAALVRKAEPAHKEAHHASHKSDPLGLSALAHRLKLDPFCKEGIMNTEMTFCCMADCVECSDTSDLCSANRTDAENPHGRESTCCPAAMEAAAVPSCENSMAPCAVPKSVRNPPDVASITAADRHAKDDCGEAVPETQAMQHLQTAYIRKQHGTVDASTTECGNFGTLVQMAAACSKRDDCMGFSSVPQTEGEETPDCMFIADNHIDLVEGSTNNIYLKREDQFTGEIFKITLGDYGECQSEGCGAGSTCCKERKIICTASSGVTVATGMCSSQVAMNHDARPSVMAKCGQEICDRNAGELQPPADLTTTTAAPTEADDPVTQGECHEALPFCLSGQTWYYYHWSLCPDGVEMSMYAYYYDFTYYFTYGPNHAGATEPEFGPYEKYYYINGIDHEKMDASAGFHQYQFKKLKMDRETSTSPLFTGHNLWVNSEGTTMSPWGWYYYNPYAGITNLEVSVQCPPGNVYYYWSPISTRYGFSENALYYYMPWDGKPFAQITFYHNCGCNSSALALRR